MRKILINLLITSAAVLLAAWILPGIHVAGFVSAIFVAIVLAFLNTFIKPVLTLLTIPVTIVTLGLFLLVINAVIVGLAGWLIDGFAVDGFWSALFFSLIVSFVGSLLKDND